MKLLSVLILVFLLAMLFTAGCTAFENAEKGMIQSESYAGDKGFASDQEYAAPIAPYEIRATPAPDYSRGYVQKTKELPEQKIIRVGEVKLEVINVTVAAEKIQDIAKHYDGLIQSLSMNGGNQNRYSGTVTIRIPADSFDRAFIDIKSIGKIISSSVNADDVTEEYVDLAAQRDALTNQIGQYNRLLAKGQNVSEILEVQKEIERVQVELDRITGRMKYLDNRASFSTITVTLSEPAQVETPGGYSLPEVVSEGIAGFVNTIVWLFILLLTVLPLILIGGAGFWAYKRWKRNNQT